MVRSALSALSALALILSMGHAAAEPGPAPEASGVDAARLPGLEGTLSDRSRDNIKAGKRIPVIVMMDVGLDGAQSRPGVNGSPDPARIAEAREQVLTTAFGPGGVHRQDELFSNAQAEGARALSQPTLLAEFSVTPGFALLASPSEIARLNETAGVAYIVEDSLSRPLLDDSTTLIGVDQLWSQGIEGAGVAVAILDTGVEVEHPMTDPAITASACFNQIIADQSTSFCPGGVESVTSLTDDSAGDSCVEDDIDSVNGTDGCSHGTHVGSTAAGRTATSSGGPVSGVARAADIIAVNVFARFQASECGDDETEPCVLSYTSDQISALEWIYNNRASLNVASVNMSLGGGENQTACTTEARRTVIQNLRNAGIATVIASGNDGFTDAVSTPSCIPEAITVGSTTKADAISSFSNSSTLIDLLAPGSSILAAWQSEEPATGQNCFDGSTPNAQGFCHFFATFSGTSMATPHVAGAFAVLKAAFPAASVDEIEAALEFTGVQITDTRNGVTRPRIQVDAAHEFLQNGGAVVSGLRIAPSEVFETSGEIADPSSFGTQLYTLTNESGSSLDFTVQTSDAWLLVDNTGGTLAAGADAQFTASVDPAALSVGGNSGQITVSVTGGDSQAIPASVFVQPPPPANDDFANALPLAGVAPQVNGSNVGADKQTGEPDHGDAGGASVWWSWTAPFDGLVDANTEGSSYDTTLGVYTGSSVDSLTTIGTNDDIDLGVVLQSRVEFTATKGQTYQFAVDGWSAATGDIVLTIAPKNPPANDNFASAEPINGAQGSVSGFLYNATKESGEPTHIDPDQGVEGGSIWYSWTAPADGSFRFRLDGTDAAATLAVYTGSVVSALTLVDKDAGGGIGLLPSAPAPSVDIAAQSGETFHIAIVDNVEPGGTVLSWHDVADSTTLLTAILPYARSVGLGETATAFVSVFNDGPVTAQNCLLEGPTQTDFPGALTYQTTDPATNALTGSPETPASIAPGERQTYVFGITPNQAFDERELSITARCDNAQAPVAAIGVNTFILSSSATEPADLLAIAATITNDGTVHLPSNTGTEVFTVAAVNIGSDANIEVLAEASDGTQVSIALCETDNSGTCLAPAAAVVNVPFTAGQTRFFSVFVTASGTDIPFDPANRRVFVKFDDGGVVRGATNVAVRTP